MKIFMPRRFYAKGETQSGGGAVQSSNVPRFRTEGLGDYIYWSSSAASDVTGAPVVGSWS